MISQTLLSSRTLKYALHTRHTSAHATSARYFTKNKITHTYHDQLSSAMVPPFSFDTMTLKYLFIVMRRLDRRVTVLDPCHVYSQCLSQPASVISPTLRGCGKKVFLIRRNQPVAAFQTACEETTPMYPWSRYAGPMAQKADAEQSATCDAARTQLLVTSRW